VEVGFGGHQLIFNTRLGGRAMSWQYQGIELLGAAGKDPVEFGFYPMVPWAGRLENNSICVNGELLEQDVNYHGWALHGVSFDCPASSWNVIESEDCTTFIARQSITNWANILDITFTWNIRAHSLETIIQVTPRSEVPTNIVVGWHPWFRKSLGVGSPAQIHINDAKILIKSDSLPTGELVDFDSDRGPFDDALIVPNRVVTIDWPGALQLRVTNSHRWFVIYTGHEDLICVEPQTGAPNSLNGPFSESVIACHKSDPARVKTQWVLTTLND
jgi:aldose 1-epimerase